MVAMERTMPKDQLFAAQVELLMRNLAAGTVLAHAAAVVVAIMLLWPSVNPVLLLGWVVFLLGVLVLRSWHMQHSLKTGNYRDHPRTVCWQLIVGITLTGLTWSAAYAYVASVAPVNVQYIFLLVIVLIAALAMGVSAVVREYYIAYLLVTQL